MSEHASTANMRRFRVEVLPPVRQGSTVSFPENWQVVGCDVTSDAGGYWVDLVVLTPLDDGSNGGLT